MKVICFVCATLVAASPLDARPTYPTSLDPCALVTTDDAFRLLGWSLSGKERKQYDVAGAAGSICFFDSPQGKIIVTVPNSAANFIGATPYNDSGAASMSRHVYGLGGEVMLYNGTAYVTRYKRSVSVHVVPNDNPASYDDVEGFAKTVISHLR